MVVSRRWAEITVKDGESTDWRTCTTGCSVDTSQPLGVWTYRWSPTPVPYAYFAFDTDEKAWEIAWDYSGYFYYGYNIAGIDAFGRDYHNAGGYRYTRGRTLIEQFDFDGWIWSMYKICKNTIGVTCTGSGD